MPRGIRQYRDDAELGAFVVALSNALQRLEIEVDTYLMREWSADLPFDTIEERAAAVTKVIYDLLPANVRRLTIARDGISGVSYGPYYYSVSFGLVRLVMPMRIINFVRDGYPVYAGFPPAPGYPHDEGRGDELDEV